MKTALVRDIATLDDRYRVNDGWVYMTGIQALVRLPLQQRARDAAAGWNTGGYISGYRGSPLGRYDMELWAAQKELQDANIVFRAGLNEDLAATAIWGSQYVGTFPGAKVDGVFGIWYGKGPGVDRSGDVLRHANHAGTSPKGGVLCLAGDDHGAKSSSVANFSDTIFMAVGMPVLYPSTTQELLEYGLHGIAMSRFSGCWVGMKVVTDVVEGGGSVYVAADAPSIILPEVPSQPRDMFGSGYHVRGFDLPLPQEDRLYNHKHGAVMAYARANGLNQIVASPDNAGVGVIAAGKAWQDVLQALGRDAAGEGQARFADLKLLKIGMVWPLDPEIVREFAQGLHTIIVVEEKRPVLEDQVRTILYGQANAPRLVGKLFAGGLFEPGPADIAFPNANEISPTRVAAVLARVLGRDLPLPATGAPAKAPIPSRQPGFCSGCPHNRSTKVPDGSRALAGIGCHGMAMLTNPKQTTTISHMGAEGVMWLGQQPFTAERHVFANIGDGTLAHSGYLAIRQAVAAKVPITYKVLYNGFVSMTGGQQVEGNLSPPQILAGFAAEGIARMAVVTDEPERYAGVALPAGVTVHHRTALDAVQREFREYPDVSVILYDQACATERRRLRKRGKLPDPDRRLFINAAVCEGCGDCGVASNCMSVEPLETELGRKRRINQGSCNKDFSCVEGFCPSFVTVEGGKPRRAVAAGPASTAMPAYSQTVPDPVILPLRHTHSVLICGIGGTGVVTIGQILAMAAHIEGLYSSNLDVTGLSQKYGAVTSHVRFAPEPQMLHATRIAEGEADALIGCDLIVAASDDALSRLPSGHGRAVVCTDLVPTNDFARNPDWQIDPKALVARIETAVGNAGLVLVDAQRLAATLVGDPIGVNMFLLGLAWQRGLIPLSAAAIERAIELNGAAVPMNKQAFLWGRRAAHDLPAVERYIQAQQPDKVVTPLPPQSRTLDQFIAHRVDHLRAHSGEAHVARYLALVEKVRKLEAGITEGDALARAVAHNYHRLLAIKDEWEVARLYTDPEFRASLEKEFEGPIRLRFHLGAWPFAKRDPNTGKPIKGEAGSWVLQAMKIMARLRGLRGSWLDPFRNNAERLLDRQILAQYEADLEGAVADLTPATLNIVTQIAALPQSIRGYGHVRQAQADATAAKREKLLDQLQAARRQRNAA